MKKHLISSLFIVLLFLLTLTTTAVEGKKFKSNIMVKVTGYSMYPTLKDNETVNCVAEEKYNVGDIIVFEKGDNTIIHRITSKVFGKYVTKGDNNWLPDLFLVDEKEVICKVSK